MCFRPNAAVTHCLCAEKKHTDRFHLLVVRKFDCSYVQLPVLPRRLETPCWFGFQPPGGGQLNREWWVFVMGGGVNGWIASFEEESARPWTALSFNLFFGFEDPGYPSVTNINKEDIHLTWFEHTLEHTEAWDHRENSLKLCSDCNLIEFNQIPPQIWGWMCTLCQKCNLTLFRLGHMMDYMTGCCSNNVRMEKSSSEVA